MNRVVLVGRLTKDADLKFTAGKGTAVATFTLAVNRRFKSEGQPEADFLPIVVWGKQAENVATYVGKGSQVGISGSIQTRSYEAKDGTKRYVTEINADEVQFLDSKKNSASPEHNSKEYEEDFKEVDTSDIPF
ncbi:single-stranded DNA-binding protein [Clostridium haemolyticum]|uniref:Single-stranded DNA-binding protein n=1 Tax=Clostridium haemolyticum NCTC 9693 TaxID=1443114 RepID=A0ABR4TGY2_CLOHA|nr:single-stranded DNA-binding protein [Clostridium haemolyticum]KEI18263.1 single-stranded DNA-binding protein [Clostridium haemolyticum NCTC 9693]KGN04188.1 single-stranded DNA-binding protein [Clostridium haemolyticum NCTC 8350]